MDTIMSFRGKLIDAMSREELIECIRYLGREFQRNNTPEAIHARALGEVELMRRQ